MIYRTIIFLLINFAALGLGGLFTSKGVSSAWYQQINKAPWTPPGWVFGAAWFTIMICFSVYMAALWTKDKNHTILILLFVIQWILNVAWNPLFFYFHLPLVALVTITLLTLLVGFLLFSNLTYNGSYSWLLVPYFVWLLIATSLNGFIVLKN